MENIYPKVFVEDKKPNKYVVSDQKSMRFVRPDGLRIVLDLVDWE
jgi:hypothetical protein